MQTFNVEQTDSQCIVTWRSLSYFVLMSFPAFVCCTAGLVFFTYLAVFVPRSFVGLLFVLPFWLLWFASLIDELFGKRRFVLDENGFEWVWTCLFLKRQKQIKLVDILQFETKEHWGNEDTEYSLCVVQQGKDASFYIPADKNELDNLCGKLNAFLKTLKEPQV